MSQRRAVRVDERFFELLDLQLPPERGPDGEPSAAEFLAIDLPPIAERFATDFENLGAPIVEQPRYRSLLTVGLVVPRVLVTGFLERDETVSLISVRFDLSATWD